MSTTSDADIACIVALEDSDAATNVVTCIVFHAWGLVFIHHEIR
jgi:hypothetical protein